MSAPAVDPVQALYEQFPYPRAETDLDDVVAGVKRPIWSPDTAFHAYFPADRQRADLDVLVAGCGTNLAPALAASLPGARVTGIDISEASLAVADAHRRRHGLRNLELIRMPLEHVGRLGRSFDWVQCTGVLHHLEDPTLGLRALAQVTRPHGALMIMVYASLGRQGVYQVQELCRALGLGVDARSARVAQQLVQRLPPDHAFRRIHPHGGPPICLEEIADLLLHPRDVAYTVPELRELVQAAGLRLHRFLGHAEYTPELCGLAAGLASLPKDPWEAAAAAELFHGTLIKHRLVLTHPGRADARSLIEAASPDHLLPRLHPDAIARRDGRSASLHNPSLQVPSQVRVSARLLDLVEAAGGERTVAELATHWPASAEQLASTLRQLYLADVVLFEVRDPAGPASAAS